VVLAGALVSCGQDQVQNGARDAVALVNTDAQRERRFVLRRFGNRRHDQRLLRHQQTRRWSRIDRGRRKCHVRIPRELANGQDPNNAYVDGSLSGTPAAAARTRPAAKAAGPIA